MLVTIDLSEGMEMVTVSKFPSIKLWSMLISSNWRLECTKIPHPPLVGLSFLFFVIRV